MFRVGPVGEQEPRDPFANLDPSNPPHPSSSMGKAVIRRANQLRKMYIGRRRANDGYHHDSSPSSGHSVLTSDEDVNEHPEFTFMLPPGDQRVVEASVRM
eukprot:266906-Amphidinium_carterae.1